MKKFPIIIFLFLLVTALCAGMCSCRQAEDYIQNNIDNALAMTMKQMPCDVVTTDTIACYRSFITIDEVRDTACIAIGTVWRNGRLETELIAESRCDFATVFMMSDQRASGTMLAVSLLWLWASSIFIRRRRPEIMLQGISYGGIVFCNDKFMSVQGHQIRLTPMQHELMEMFFHAENYTLSKQDICDRLWPKKSDASDTLYTLIRRVRPIIEANSDLKIESDKKSYSLTLKSL